MDNPTPLELVEPPADAPHPAPPLMACSDCGCLVVLDLVRVHARVCPGRGRSLPASLRRIREAKP